MPTESPKNTALPDDDEQIKNLSVPQIKQIIAYVRAMEQSSLDLSDQMSSILQNIDSLESQNQNLTTIVDEQEKQIKGYQKSQETTMKELMKAKETSSQKNE